MTFILRVKCKADGGPTPHDGRFVTEWNPHTKAGTLELNSTDDPNQARVFNDIEELSKEWRTVSNIEPTRPWDGEPNRPLTGITLEIIPLEKIS